MSKKLYVGNLSYGVSEEDLSEAFAKVGEVLSAKIITDPETGRSRGFGFVEMANDEDAEKAIASLDGTVLNDRTIVVKEARPKPERGGRPGGGGGGGRGGKRGNYGKERQPDNWRYR